jgi:hypothetical protein
MRQIVASMSGNGTPTLPSRYWWSGVPITAVTASVNP